MEDSPSVSLPYSSPQWDTLEAQVLCPLCEYNLRGLSEPRCPECGYQFNWTNLLDESRRRHRYLFEHHPERNFRSFVQTVMHGILPVDFWTTLRADQTLNMRRLLTYWLVSMLLAFPGFVSIVVLRTTGLGFNGPDGADWLIIVLCIVLWPMLTLACLMIFQISMRRAKVKPSHVMRCVVYSSDAILWAGIALLAWTAAQVFLHLIGVSSSPGTGVLVLMLLIFLTWLLFIVRVTIAYACYLKFPHTIAMIVASQIITPLALVVGFILAIGR